MAETRFHEIYCRMKGGYSEGHSGAGKEVQCKCSNRKSLCQSACERAALSSLNRSACLFLRSERLWLSVTFSLALVVIGHFQISAGLFSLSLKTVQIQRYGEEEVEIETSGSGWFRWTHGSFRLACGELLFSWRKPDLSWWEYFGICIYLCETEKIK